MTSYFSDRKLRIRYKGLISNEKGINAGLGQGSLLGLWCFLLLINFAGPQNVPSQLGLRITQNQNVRKPLDVLKKSWVDDLVIMTSVDLKAKSVINPSLREEGPVPFHSRTLHSLPEENNILQHEAIKLQQFANENFMKINQLKTKVAIFNPLNKIDVMPKISFDGQNDIEVVEDYKLLGQILSTDMKTLKNTQNIL